jgi:hypothetical protein
MDQHHHGGMSMGKFLAIAAVAIYAVLLFALPAPAHEWYPPSCCSGGDCAPIAEQRVRATPTGYLVDEKFPVKHSEVRKSMDGRYHGCFPKPTELRCFFAPPRGL